MWVVQRVVALMKTSFAPVVLPPDNVRLSVAAVLVPAYGSQYMMT